MRPIDADALKEKIEIDNFDSPMMNPVMTMTKVLEYIDEAPTVDRPHEKWEYLKEHITDMRDADGESHLNQKQICQFILNLMGVIEEEGDEND